MVVDPADKSQDEAEADQPDGPPARQILLRSGQAGRFETSYSGDRSTGESNREEIAQTVVHFLREWGEQWAAPRLAGESDRSADMLAAGPAGSLRLQITRVPWPEAHWARLARQGHVATSATPAESAADLIQAIRGKAGHYSAADRSTLVLVLDGTRSIVYDLPPTLQAYREHFLDEARASGFEDIFLVGLVRFINLLNPPEGSEWFSIA